MFFDWPEASLLAVLQTTSQTLPCLCPLVQFQEAPPPPGQQHSPPSLGLLLAPWVLHLPRVRGGIRKEERQRGKLTWDPGRACAVRRESTQSVESLQGDGEPGSQPCLKVWEVSISLHLRVIPQIPVSKLYKNGISGSSSETDLVLSSAVYAIADLALVYASFSPH